MQEDSPRGRWAGPAPRGAASTSLGEGRAKASFPPGLGSDSEHSQQGSTEGLGGQGQRCTPVILAL